VARPPERAQQKPVFLGFLGDAFFVDFFAAAFFAAFFAIEPSSERELVALVIEDVLLRFRG
jgi:hypothetical protein